MMVTKINKTILLVMFSSAVIILFISSLFSPLLYAGKNNERAKIFVDASSNNFPPMNLLDQDGTLTGFGRELADAIMKAVGAEVNHIHSPHWDEVLEWLDSGKADFIHDAGYTKARDGRVAPADSSTGALARSVRGRFDHTAPPLIRLMEIPKGLRTPLA